MELLADENVETEWVQALSNGGHDIARVVDVEELGVSATDSNVLAGANQAESSPPDGRPVRFQRPTDRQSSRHRHCR